MSSTFSMEISVYKRPQIPQLRNIHDPKIMDALDQGPSSSVFEVAISPSELFQDLGVLVVEGRIPELSSNGRRTGIHSWPLTNHSKKTCCLNNDTVELCTLVGNTRSKILSFLPTQSLVIDVFATPQRLEETESNKKQKRIYIDKAKISNMILLERWKINIKEKRESCEYVNVNMVLQAVRSYLHFSQLSAWWNSSSGTFPSHTTYRISYDSDEKFLTNSEAHYFPWTEISKSQSMQITVHSLPRMEITDLSFIINQHKNLNISNTFSDTLNKSTYKNDKCSSVPNNSVCSSSNQDNALMQNTDFSCSNSLGKRKDTEIDKYFLNHLRTSNCQTTSYVGEKIIKLDENSKKNYFSNDNNHNKMKQNQSCSSKGVKAESLSSLLSKCSNQTPKKDLSDMNGGLADLLQNFFLNENDTIDDSSDDDDEDEDSTYDPNNCCEDQQLLSEEQVTPPRCFEYRTIQNSYDIKPCQRIRSKSASPNFTSKQGTIFNPNDTVVKVFVVLYNFDDMPSSSKTFLRQRMISVRKDPKTMADVQFSHYLVHLSFLASKHSHLYLHTDIRIIFPQQTPDRPLLTITESPTHPKYTPILNRHNAKEEY